jgi:hypothetical protein
MDKTVRRSDVHLSNNAARTSRHAHMKLQPSPPSPARLPQAQNRRL